MGLCDLLSIHTALFDWNLSQNNNQENKNNLIYDIAQTLLNHTFELIKPQDKIEITKIFELLLFSGYITNIMVVVDDSGSEHIFAKYLETKINIPLDKKTLFLKFSEIFYF